MSARVSHIDQSRRGDVRDPRRQEDHTRDGGEMSGSPLMRGPGNPAMAQILRAHHVADGGGACRQKEKEERVLPHARVTHQSYA